MSKDRAILVIDVGNTSAEFCLFKNDRIAKRLRIPTAELPHQLTRKVSRLLKYPNLEACVVASVVPPADKFLKKALTRLFKGRVCIAGKDLKVPVKNLYTNPKQVGTDRLMNAVAIHERHGKDAIVLDFGTAITFDVISKKGDYLGGTIAPGIEISLDALFRRTALLPKIKLSHPRSVIGKNTVESIKAGCAYGIGGLCDRIVDEIKKKFSPKALVIATGGYAQFMRRYCRSIQSIEPDLVLWGILFTYRNSYPR